MKHKDLEHYRLLLQAERRQLLETMESFKEQGIHENMNDVSGELSAYDQHPADYGSQMFEREKDQGLLENLKDQLHLVDQALERIDQGTYGICRQCRQPISPERLEVLPQASLCVRCKLEEENSSSLKSKNKNFRSGAVSQTAPVLSALMGRMPGRVWPGSGQRTPARIMRGSVILTTRC